ncbi:hypothetical protein CS006_00265 [Bifidobacterium primatium]|uniref:Uncharacterized protein n=2 Tax=Bifidobacterium TaxID=1678 RepID=A0A2M9HA35_9BIFI|nr:MULTISPECIES: ABC-2 transporter permease [Bifidobacterium]NEG95921.1 hypothetical protein [Bifidobacterium sp. SMB2]NEH11768.1 hypothetical protein [Bifidobacterium saimiriisciurei]PJM73669.1 hypothetical protein CS006_00265 [Bifidobacterium primatium]
MNAVVKSMRVDWARITSGGWGMIAGYMLMSPAMMALFGILFGGDDSAGAIAWLYQYISGMNLLMFVSFVTFPAVYQDTGNNADMNGLMPVSRRNQVIGRYVYLLLFGIMLVVENTVMYPLGFAAAGALGTMGAMPWRTIAIQGLVYALCSALVLVCSYRFKGQTLMYVVVFGGSALLILGFVVTMRFEDQVRAVAEWLGGHVFSSMGLTVALGVVVAVIALAVSYLASVRIYERREM